MESNELRIGNYLEILGKVRKVECISNLPSRKEMYWITCKDIIDTKIIHFKPIALTDEWLFKFGFIKMKNYRTKQLGHSKYDWFKDNTQFFSIEKHHSGDFNEGETFYPTFTFNNCSFALQYVHELQNLYFSLTKDELKINDINE